MTDALPAIQACKHCGSPAHVDRVDTTDYWVFVVECERCDACYGSPTERLAIEGWNRTYRSPEEMRQQEAHGVIAKVRDIARTLGWAVGIHGSLVRDIDLIAVPWAPEAASLAVFLQAVEQGLGYVPLDDSHPLKPHGRRAFLRRDPKATWADDPKGTWTPAVLDLSVVDLREVTTLLVSPTICPSCHRVASSICADPWHRPRIIP